MWEYPLTLSGSGTQLDLALLVTLMRDAVIHTPIEEEDLYLGNSILRKQDGSL
jgi:hypothetical protein